MLRKPVIVSYQTVCIRHRIQTDYLERIREEFQYLSNSTYSCNIYSDIIIDLRA